MNQMPPYGMYPPMGMGPSVPDNQDKFMNLESQINRLERQIRRIDNRLNRIEASMINPLNSQDTGYGNNNTKYMM